jgi:uncharacterized surface protein with fasciclin (FAS1) repeats
MHKRATAVAAAFAGLAISLTACSSSGGSSGTPAGNSGNTGSSAMSTPMSSGMSSGKSGGAMGASMTGAQFGSGCSAVPKSPSNPGSFDAMAKVPVATAASGNPVLSTLVTAVTKAGLADTLNNAKALTVFAPADSAFAAIPKKTLNSVLANKKELTKILEYHVVGKRLSPNQLKGSVKTLEGGTLKFSGSKPNITVGPSGKEAHVVCGNVQTANATVYIIDSVMMPKM